MIGFVGGDSVAVLQPAGESSPRHAPLIPRLRQTRLPLTAAHRLPFTLSLGDCVFARRFAALLAFLLA